MKMKSRPIGEMERRQEKSAEPQCVYTPAVRKDFSRCRKHEMKGAPRP